MPVARDSTPPLLHIHLAHAQDLLRHPRLRLAVSCSESCVLRAAGTARGLKLRGALERLAAHQRALVELGLGARVRHALARRGSVRVGLRARDSAGNLTTASRVVRVER
jgi:hypothetical protein